MDRYYSFPRFLREKLGQTVFKVCIDAGFSCPNWDGALSQEGCVYCDNRSFSPLRFAPRMPIARQIEEGIQRQKRRKGKESRFLAYFQSYTNTYAPTEQLKELYRAALSREEIAGLNISTRPDCLSDSILDYLGALSETRFVLLELGLQSSHDETLRRMNRGHDYACFLKAVERVKCRSIALGAHIILGFPGETEEMMLQTAGRLAALPIDCLKIHNLQIVKETKLADLYAQNPFPLWERHEYIDFLCSFLEHLSPRTAIARFFASTPDCLLMAPAWAKDNRGLLEEIRKALHKKNTYQGKVFLDRQAKEGGNLSEKTPFA